MSTVSNTYEVVIKPRQSWLHVDWKGLVQYRDLIYVMVRRDFIARYKQTILGPAWFIVNPILTSLTFTLVFSRVLGVSTNGIPPVLFYLSGNLVWTYFSGLVNNSGNSLLHNAGLFGKVYFPRLIVPLALSISNAVQFFIQLATFLVVLIFYVSTGKFSIPPLDIVLAVLLVPLFLIHSAVLALGVGLSLASLTAKYRDFQHLLGFLLQLWMYATPIIYPFAQIQTKFPHWGWLAALNPMSAVIEGVRALFLDTPPLPTGYYILSVGVSLFIFVFGVLTFQRTARTFIDTV